MSQPQGQCCNALRLSRQDFELCKFNNSHSHCHIFKGHAAPGEELGYPGDAYLEASQKWHLKMSSGWEAFQDTSDTLKQKHPSHPGFVFYITGKPMWRSCRGIISSRSQKKQASSQNAAVPESPNSKLQATPRPPKPIATPKKDDTTYLGNRLGHEFPVDAKTVVWRGGNGVRTVLPYARPDYEGMWKGKEKGKKRSVGVDLNEDVVNVQEMALRPWYEDVPQMFEEVVLPSGAEKDLTQRSAIDAALRANLRHNKFTIVRGWEPAQQVKFEEESIRAWVGSLSQLVEWQDAGRRLVDPAHPHKTTTLGEFLLERHNPSVCGNLLNLLDMRAQLPWFMCELDDGMKALNLTTQASYAVGKRKAGEQLPTVRPVQGNAEHGSDAFRLRFWKIVTHAGFHTRRHSDAAGLGTFVYLHEGAKAWCVIFPSVKACHDTRDKVFAYLDKLAHYEASKDVFQICGAAVYLLEPGSVLIQPAGCIHEVYTFTDTLMAGGHFTCLDMMHLTETTRAFHHQRAENVTNAEHEAVVSILARMLLSISIYDGLVLPLRCLLALVQQNLVAEEYLPQTGVGHSKIPPNIKADVEAAKVVGRQVLKCLNLTQRQAQEIVERGGVEWDQAGERLVTVADLNLPGVDLEYR